jgi:hypothetical protein
MDVTLLGIINLHLINSECMHAWYVNSFSQNNRINEHQVIKFKGGNLPTFIN